MLRTFLLFLALTIVMLSHAGEPQRGYRGFVDLDNAIGYMDYFDNTDGQNKHDCQWFIGISTSHGYQLNRHVFLGAGVMISAATPSGEMTVPVFADFRYDGLFGCLTPFGNLRLGYNFDEGGDIYFSPAIGYRVNWGRKMNLNLGFGITLRGKTEEVYNWDVRSADPTYSKKHLNDTFITFRIGIDF